MATSGVVIDQVAFQKMLRRGILLTGDLRPWFKGSLDKGVTSFLRRQFDTLGTFGGTPWAPLKPSTMRSRLRSGGNRGGIGHPLWDFGDLRRSLLTPGSRGFLRTITAKSYQRGTSIPYAQYHQEGTQRFPARVLIPDPPTFVVKAWEKSLGRWIRVRLGSGIIRR